MLSLGFVPMVSLGGVDDCAEAAGKLDTNRRNLFDGSGTITEFNEREKAFEAKFKQDQEFKFKVTARRNKLLGLWAAEKLGLSGDAAEAYAKEVVRADFEEPGDDDVLRKVVGDFKAKSVDVSEHLVRKHMDELMETAAEQIGV